jgi:adenosylcobinamide amidohydrolase
MSAESRQFLVRGMPDAEPGAQTFDIVCAPPLLTARFVQPQRTLGWTLLHPGFATIHVVVWFEVLNRDLGPDVDPRAFLRRKLADTGFPDALAFITSCDIRRRRFAAATVEGVTTSCLTTVGLSNGERVGSRRPIRALAGAGTINTLVHVSCPLTDGALVEAVSIVAEARTAAILESHPPQVASAITGTGTDCIVVATPFDRAQAPCAGLHTPVGEAIGAAVYRATREGAQEWFAENAGSVGMG